jgi:uncharacterized repeat protein (TIGR01451 family)
MKLIRHSILFGSWLGVLVVAAILLAGGLGLSPGRSAQAAAPSGSVTSQAAPAVVNIIATKRDAIQTDVDGDGKADPGDTLRYTVGITNTGTTSATVAAFNDTLDANTSLVAGSVKVSPLAFDDSFSAIGHTLLAVGVAAPAGTPAVQVAGNLFTNDTEFLGDTFSLSTFQATSANGGTVNVNANGTFTYLPAVNFTGGTDSFTYTIVDPGGLTGTATVFISVAHKVWYVNNGAGTNGDGRSSSPFNTLTNVNGAGGSGDADGPNDFIYIHTGGGNHTGGLPLESGQTLIGQGVALVVGGFTLHPAGSRPTVTHSGGDAITLNSNNTVSGLNVLTGGAALFGIKSLASSVGNFTMNNASISGAGQPVDITNGGALNVVLDSVSTTSSNNRGINLDGTTGTFTVNGGSLAGITGSDVRLNSGTVVFSYSGTINNTSNDSVEITNRTGGSATFSGAITDTGTGITLTSNTGSTNTFSGGISLNTGASIGLNATGGGTLTVTGVNMITTTTGSALVVANTTIGAGDLTFRSISANGAPSGISLNNTGSSGNLLVTGVGTTDGSGGTIQNITNRGVEIISSHGNSLKNINFVSTGTADGAAGTCGSDTVEGNTGCNGAIHLQNVTGVTIDNINTNGGQYGINGNAVSGFSLANSSILNMGDEPLEDGIRFINLTGNNTISSSTIQDNAASQMNIYQSTGTADMSVTSSTFDGKPLSGNGVRFLTSGGATRLALSGPSCFVQNNPASGVIATLQGTDDKVIMTNCTVQDNNIGFDFGVNNAGVGRLNVSGSTFLRHQSNAFNIITDGTSTSGTMDGIITGNTVGDPAVAASGSALHNGIAVDIRGSVNSKFAITNNTISRTNLRGITFEAIDPAAVAGQSVSHVNIKGNTVNQPQHPSVIVESINVTSRDSAFMCLDIGGAGALSNNSIPSAVPGSTGYRLRQSGTVGAGSVFQLEGFAGNGTIASQVESFVVSRNATPPGQTAVVATGGAGTIVNYTSGTCQDPPSITGPERATGNSFYGSFASASVQSGAALAAKADAVAGHVEKSVGLKPERANVSYSGAKVTLASFSSLKSAKASAFAAPNDVVSVNIGTLPDSGKRVLILFDATIISAPIPAGLHSVSNQGTVSGGNFSSVLTDDPDTGAPNDPTVTLIDAAPDLFVTKSDGGITVRPGDPITYTLSYSNVGTQGATGVVLTDTVPANTTFNPAASSPGWTCVPNNNAGSTCTKPIGGMVGGATGSALFGVYVNLSITPPGTTITNTASIGDDLANGTEPVTSNNTATETTGVTTPAGFVWATGLDGPGAALAAPGLYWEPSSPMSSTRISTGGNAGIARGITATGAVLWTQNLGAAIQNRAPVIPISNTNVLFFTSQDGYVNALRANDGSAFWPGGGRKIGDSVVAGVAYQPNVPVLITGTTSLIFAGTFHDATPPNNQFVALNALTGAPVWNFGGTLTATMGLMPTSPAAHWQSNTVFFGTKAPTTGSGVGAVWALDTTTGLAKWVNTSIGSVVNSAPSLSQDGQTLYVGTVNGSTFTLYALRTIDGTVRASFTAPGGVGDFRGAPWVWPNAVNMAHSDIYATAGDRVYAFTDNGTVTGTLPFKSGWASGFAPVPGASTPILVPNPFLPAPGALYASGNNATVYKINLADGTISSTTVLGSSMAAVSELSFDRVRSVFYLTYNGAIYSLDLTW